MYTVEWNGTEYACRGAKEVQRLYHDLGIDKAKVYGQIASIRMSNSMMTMSEVNEWVRMNEE